jgi:hypothetical protein
MSRIFICYRREDSEYIAHQIKEHLVNRFGSDSIIFDIDSTPLGADFRQFIDQKVARCDVLLAIIGNNWLRTLNERLKDPKDFVRIELEAGLAREIAVVPVVVGLAAMPQEKELPKTLRQLVYRNATEVRGGHDLKAHLDRLVDKLDKMLTPEITMLPEQLTCQMSEHQTPSPSSKTTTAESKKIKKSGCAGVLVKFFFLLAVVAVIGFMVMRN